MQRIPVPAAFVRQLVCKHSRAASVDQCIHVCSSRLVPWDGSASNVMTCSVIKGATALVNSKLITCESLEWWCQCASVLCILTSSPWNLAWQLGSAL